MFQYILLFFFFQGGTPISQQEKSVDAPARPDPRHDLPNGKQELSVNSKGDFCNGKQELSVNGKHELLNGKSEQDQSSNQ